MCATPGEPDQWYTLRNGNTGEFAHHLHYDNLLEAMETARYWRAAGWRVAAVTLKEAACREGSDGDGGVWRKRKRPLKELSTDEIRDMQTRYRRGGASVSCLAKIFNVSYSTAKYTLKRKALVS